MTMSRDFLFTSNCIQIQSIRYHLYTLWLLTRSDLKTIIYTQTAVGVFNGLAGASITTNPRTDFLHIISRAPLVVLWNWLNLIVFNLANQRLPNSILEDSINKPWRALPSKRLSPENATLLLLRIIPCGLAILYCLGGYLESLWMVVLTWMYNDLGGADGSFVVRNLINAGAFILHARGSTIVAVGKDFELTPQAHTWIFMIGAIIFSTLQTQDLEDIEGDALRGRRTMPLVLGERVARVSVAVPVAFWSIFCPMFWSLPLWGYVPSTVVGTGIAFRVLNLRNVAADRKTWQLWCVWIICIYLIPLLKNHDVIVTFWREITAYSRKD